MNELKDKFGRRHNYLRISLTDKCNLNCLYCNPKENQIKIAKKELLTYEEFIRLIRIFIKLGINKIRFTGGEPLIRKDVMNFFKEVSELKKIYGFELGITTNGTLLSENLKNLKQYGFSQLNVSLDTLDKKKFEKITGRDDFQNVMNAIVKSFDSGFYPIKINCVVMKGINDDEIFNFIELTKENNYNIRFIEYMPFSNNKWDKDYFISSKDILNKIKLKYQLFDAGHSGVADEFGIHGHKGKIGLISPISNHFCYNCNRLRITAEGNMKLCLFTNKNESLNLKILLNDSKISDAIIERMISEKLISKNETHPDINKLRTLKDNNMINLGG